MGAYLRFHWLHKQLHYRILFLSNKGGRLIKQTGGVETLCLRRQWDTGLKILAPFPYLQTDRCNIFSCSSSVVFTNRQQLFRNQPNVEIFCNCWCRGIVTSKGIQHWAIKRLGVHVIFPPDAVSEPTSIVVQRWKYSVCSPPLQEHEAITSNVIELSPMDGQGLKFNTKVKLSLSHSATELRGYELVIKKLIDKDTNIWEDVDGTIDIRCCQGIGSPFIQ